MWVRLCFAAVKAPMRPPMFEEALQAAGATSLDGVLRASWAQLEAADAAIQFSRRIIIGRLVPGPGAGSLLILWIAPGPHNNNEWSPFHGPDVPIGREEARAIALNECNIDYQQRVQQRFGGCDDPRSWQRMPRRFLQGSLAPPRFIEECTAVWMRRVARTQLLRAGSMTPGKATSPPRYAANRARRAVLFVRASPEHEARGGTRAARRRGQPARGTIRPQPPQAHCHEAEAELVRRGFKAPVRSNEAAPPSPPSAADGSHRLR